MRVVVVNKKASHRIEITASSQTTGLEGTFPPAWFGAGIAYAAQEEDDQAMTEFRTTARLFPRLGEPRRRCAKSEDDEEGGCVLSVYGATFCSAPESTTWLTKAHTCRWPSP